MKITKITGSLIEAYIFCPRQAWLLSRQITGNQYNEFLEIGRLLSDTAYKKEKKEMSVEGGKIDFLKSESGEIIVVEVKKSGKFIKTSKMQLVYYMHELSKKGLSVKGEIRIPKEKKVIKVDYTDKEEREIEKIIKETISIIEQNVPPKVKRSAKCKNCSYAELCWS